MGKPRVFLVHGLNSGPERFEGVRAVLEPHFECVVPTYRGFDGRKTLWKRCTAFLRAVRGGSPKREAIRQLQEFYDASTVSGGELHAIAHSFGTVLMAALLRDAAYARFARVLFVGSPLPRHFGWKAFEGRIEALRNEVGRRDWVVASTLPVLFHPGFGLAGLLGFSSAHTIPDAQEACRHCADPAATHWIHNVKLRGYGHSRSFLLPRHARDLWLPWLWGIVPSDYARFLSTCHKVVLAQREGRHADLDERLDHLADSPWRRASRAAARRTFGEHVTYELDAKHRWQGANSPLPAAEQGLPVILFWVCKIVAEAAEALEGDDPTCDPIVIRHLDPRIAVGKAVQGFLDDLGRQHRGSG